MVKRVGMFRREKPPRVRTYLPGSKPGVGLLELVPD